MSNSLITRISDGNTAARQILNILNNNTSDSKQYNNTLRKLDRVGKKGDSIIDLFVAAHEYDTRELVMREYLNYILSYNDSICFTNSTYRTTATNDSNISRRVCEACQQMIVLVSDLIEK